MRLMQVTKPDGGRAVVATDRGESWLVAGVDSVFELARRAFASSTTVAEMVLEVGSDGSADVMKYVAEGRVLPPVDHPDPAHLIVSGTGLTHLGSATTRDAMRKGLAGGTEGAVSDSMRMFCLGIEGGKPAPGVVGAQPEWFYKGDGSIIVPPGDPLVSPSFADDAGEEPEVAGVYLIGSDGSPVRIGFTLCNEFSDHVMERQNYLWLAHSKLRPIALGPELLLGELPESIEGTSRIWRRGTVIFEKPFLTGEANMSHSVANLEAHHFKYRLFRRPGDLHVHSFGTGTLSFADGIRVEPGDVFEIEAPGFGLALINPVEMSDDGFVTVRPI